MKVKNKVKKWRKESFTLLLNILKLIENKEYPSKIARLLGKSKQTINYYIRRLRDEGYIRREVRDAIVFYELTDLGKNFLEWLEGSSFSFGFVRLERVVFRYPVLGGLDVNGLDRFIGNGWRVNRLRNWVQLHGRVFNVFVRLNLSGKPSLEVYCEPIEGKNPFELYYYARVEADYVARCVERDYGLKLGVPEESSRPEWAVFDPVANKFTENFNLKTSDAKMDRSPPRRLGEIEWFNPEAAKEYLLMPLRVKELLGRIARLESGLVQIFQTWNIVGNRLLEILPSSGPGKCRLCGKPSLCSILGGCRVKDKPDAGCLHCPERLCAKHYLELLEAGAGCLRN